MSFFTCTISLSKFSLSCLSILITSILNPVSGRLIVSTLFSSFLEFCSILSFRICFFVSSFWLPLCTFFYLLGRSALSPSLGRMALCSRCPVGPSGAVSLITWAWCSRSVPCVGLCVLLLWLSLDCAVIMSVGRTDPPVDRPWELAMITVFELLCGGWPHRVGFTPMVSGASQDHPLGVVLVEQIRWFSVVVWSQQLSVLGRGLVQTKASCCLWPAPDYLSGPTKQSKVGRCLC